MRFLTRKTLFVMGLMAVATTAYVPPSRGQSGDVAPPNRYVDQKSVEGRIVRGQDGLVLQGTNNASPSNLLILDTRYLESQSPERFDIKTRGILGTYHSYTDANRAEFFEKLTAVVTLHFEYKQSAREQELKTLEEQLKKLRALHEQRLKEKKEIIQDRVRQLTREAAGLGWGGDSPAEANLFEGGKPADPAAK